MVIGDPQSSGSGSFTFNEVVTGAASSATARVRTWNSVTNILELGNVAGEFIKGENIVGSSSGAIYPVRVIDDEPTDDGFADNLSIENEADSILDFSEQNPFGIP